MRCADRAGRPGAGLERHGYGRFSGGGRPTKIAVEILRIEGGLLAEHWDVIQDEATRAESKSGLPMFGITFPGA